MIKVTNLRCLLGFNCKFFPIGPFREMSDWVGISASDGSVLYVDQSCRGAQAGFATMLQNLKKIYIAQMQLTPYNTDRDWADRDMSVS